ncbi:MAG: hypothetical protein ACRD8Z_28035, partial [Nitrososphaeraceae archaeon]
MTYIRAIVTKLALVSSSMVPPRDLYLAHLPFLNLLSRRPLTILEVDFASRINERGAEWKSNSPPSEIRAKVRWDTVENSSSMALLS